MPMCSLVMVWAVECASSLVIVLSGDGHLLGRDACGILRDVLAEKGGGAHLGVHVEVVVGCAAVSADGHVDALGKELSDLEGVHSGITAQGLECGD